MNNACLETRGGWFIQNTLRSTGVAFGTVISLLSPPIDANIGTTSSKFIARVPYDPFLPHLRIAGSTNVELQRTVAEDLLHIRSVLKAGVSELAAVFGVSRQAIYNWLGGETPSQSHTEKIKDLAAAADVIEAEGIAITGYVLKRKIRDGKSLFEIVRDGGSAEESAQVLAGILRRESEQRRMLELRLASREKLPIDSIDIGLPVVNE